MMFSNRNLPLSCAFNSAFSSRSRCCALDRRDRFGDTAEPGHHHRANLRIPLESLVEYCHAVGVGQPQVDDESVVRERPEPLDGIGGVAGLGGGKAVGFEAGDDGLSEIEVVFDDQNGRQGALGHMFVRVNKSSPDADIQDPATGVQVGKPERWLTDPSLHLPKN
jgi:hypothetical protein